MEQVKKINVPGGQLEQSCSTLRTANLTASQLRLKQAREIYQLCKQNDSTYK